MTSILDNILDSSASSSNEQAKTWLKNNGVPTNRDESWKYTNPAKFMTGKSLAPKVVQSKSLEKLSPYFIKVSANDIASNLPAGVNLKKNNLADEVIDFSSALNRLHNAQNYLLEVEKKTIIDQPILIIHTNEIAPSFEIKVGQFAEIAFLESFAPDAEQESTTYARVKLTVEDGAHVQHIKTVIGGAEQIHIAKTTATIAKNATADFFIFASGSKLTRQELLAEINQSGSHVNAHGLFALRANQHADQHITLNHNAAHTTSDQLFKMVLDDESRGVFTGRLEIAKDAQKVDASQLNKNLVLSKKAHVDTRPQLLVHADDVKCAHGATVGQLSPEEVFYLRSRGINQQRAQKILCHAFASDAILRIKSEVIRHWVNDLLFENFEQFALEKFES
ncbi:MAG: Fe-S cluster assembly protein SufD [Bdellovibrionales bacterium CG12_big_fil_rev_8_21_14_0_65_38_15]|nr:MAG: Fe-S cluster assembly protein SufD [Bdellovibrionales bacterium CG22_combo_CG10-13_8_21_14_all_38_13]PIQ57454.1 MAG: Fe-S cluster assembly protein SufD [Bdellovibrionales bacterium CG12_big_fil_rev_8_21_14_0_65_38_15]PIR31175.1 MAG: Fe-S cluster assembly protein SufD [Bdellovibrionales bacterium CG11_big_fil_rev_8_21_14_0_20_38_13]